MIKVDTNDAKVSIQVKTGFTAMEIKNILKELKKVRYIDLFL